MPEGVVSVGQYYWVISSPSIGFFNGVIQIPLSALAGVTDPSKLVWLKRTNSGDTWVNIGGIIQDGYFVSTITFDSFSEFTIGTSSNGNPLPVELNSFSATVSNSMEVTLSWKTITEVNNYGFNIEKKLANSSQWHDIGFVVGHGNSNSPKVYSFIDESVSPGNYFYRLKQVDNDGKFTYSKQIQMEVNSLPKEFALFQNFPNPFNPVTKIKYAIPVDGLVNISVFNMLGQKVKQIINTNIKAGTYEVNFDGSKLSSGTYFYRLESGTFSQTKKLLLLK